MKTSGRFGSGLTVAKLSEALCLSVPLTPSNVTSPVVMLAVPLAVR